MDISTIVSQVVTGLTVKDEAGAERVDYTALKEVMEQLSAVRKSAKEANEAYVKEQKATDKAVKAEAGKAYAATLAEGDRVKYTMANGSVIEATVGKQKDGAKTLHVVLDAIPEGSKTADRHVAFDKLIIA